MVGALGLEERYYFCAVHVPSARTNPPPLHRPELAVGHAEVAPPASTAAREEALRQEVLRLREALGVVLMTSLLNIRRAAFAPEFGVRYTEAIRAGIANECARLEDHVRRVLE